MIKHNTLQQKTSQDGNSNKVIIFGETDDSPGRKAQNKMKHYYPHQWILKGPDWGLLKPFKPFQLLTLLTKWWKR